MSFSRSYRALSIVVLCFFALSFYQIYLSGLRVSVPSQLSNFTLPKFSIGHMKRPFAQREKLEVVVAQLKQENTTWLYRFFPDWPKKAYVVDDPAAALTVPQNKGHESMVYLT